MTKIDEAIRAAQEAYSVYGKTGDLRATPPSAGNVKSMLSAALAILLPAEPSEMIEKMAQQIHEEDIGETFPWAKREAHMKEPFRRRARAAYRGLRLHLGLE